MAQSYSGRDLRKQHFAGQYLRGRDFSDADLREANFAEATLYEANFSGADATLGVPAEQMMARIRSEYHKRTTTEGRITIP